MGFCLANFIIFYNFIQKIQSIFIEFVWLYESMFLFTSKYHIINNLLLKLLRVFWGKKWRVFINVKGMWRLVNGLRDELKECLREELNAGGGSRRSVK